ncbi:hypothetical protein [Blastopirellula marina]|uniref:Uncharacterized protein n=1 Tax=Blastopirellula marina TaxID=124 RepID=A0A2S8F3B9_9BACT|nr:hypothetical protein [Blastopirellula marina]PQO26649.1 hypothetical protein C5Y98_30175 [Blastopirellula marina]PTL40960.1 hypothetical protein C5Y97_30190 [Blastopirellula marina]
MRFAAYGAAVLFVLLAVAINAALVVGLANGVIQIDGFEMTIYWRGESDGYVHWDRGGLHDFYVSGPIVGFVFVAALPLAMLAILAALLFNRSSSRREK